jgi:hypothetical protein
MNTATVSKSLEYIMAFPGKVVVSVEVGDVVEILKVLDTNSQKWYKVRLQRQACVVWLSENILTLS